MPEKLPPAYEWLNAEPGPRILREFINVHGTAEVKGPRSNPTILAWAKSVGLDRVYRDDSTAWCGLAMAYVAGQAGWDNAPRGNALLARNWLYWGAPAPKAMLGDVLVFWRGNLNGTKGHVGVYVGEDATAYHVLGGNQDDRVSIKRLEKGRLIEARRCPWRINQPSNVRVVQLASNGKYSTDEA